MRAGLCDDHPVTLQGLRALLETRGWSISWECRSVHELLALLAASPVELVISDLFFAGRAAYLELARLRLLQPGVKVLVYTMAEDPLVWKQLQHLGLACVVSKASPPLELLAAIENLLGGRATSRPQEGPEPFAPCLSPRQLAILGLLAQGFSTKEIARELAIRPETVKTHVERMRAHLGAKNRLALLAHAFRLGLVPRP